MSQEYVVVSQIEAGKVEVRKEVWNIMYGDCLEYTKVVFTGNADEVQDYLKKNNIEEVIVKGSITTEIEKMNEVTPKKIENYNELTKEEVEALSFQEVAAHLLAVDEEMTQAVASLQEIAERYGDVDEYGLPTEAAKAKWIGSNLTDEDIEAWHEGNCTEHTRRLMDRMNVDCIQVWGSNTGTEPLSVNLC